MHSLTLVLLPPPFDGDLQALLAPHRLDEENYNPGWRTDYWTTGDEEIRDDATERALGIDPEDYVYGNVCFVRNLPADLRAANVVTPDGQWQGLFDFGWRLLRDDTAENRAAADRWNLKMRELLAAHMDCVAIGMDTHS